MMHRLCKQFAAWRQDQSVQRNDISLQGVSDSSSVLVKETAAETKRRVVRSVAQSALLVLGASVGLAQQVDVPSSGELPKAYPLPPVNVSQSPQIGSQNETTSNNQLRVPPSLTSSNATGLPGAKPVDSELKVYDLPVELVGTVSAQLQLRYNAMPNVKITTEPNTGRLMVMGPSAAHRDIQAQVAQVRQRVATGNQPVETIPTQRRTYQLRNITPANLQEALRRLAGARLTITRAGDGSLLQYRFATKAGLQDILQLDQNTGAVTLQGSSRNIAAWMRVITSMDSPREPNEQPPTLTNLDRANPRTVQKALQFARFNFQNNQQGGTATGARQIGDNDPATGISDIQNLGSDSGVFGDVQIEFVEELGVVIVKGSKRDVQRVLEVIDDIKRQSEQTQPEVEIYPLQHVNSDAVAEVVIELYEQVLAARQGNVSITSLSQPNALLLIGRKEAIISLKELLGKIDQPLDPTSQLKVFRLLHASADDAETTIRSFFVQEAGRLDETRAGIGVRVSVVSDYRTNSLIVQASPRDLKEVARLISEIDVENTAAQNEIKVFPLKNAIAEELQPVLQTAVTGRDSDGGGDDNEDVKAVSSKLTIQSLRDSQLESGILSNVVVTANPSINALVVRAPSQSMPLIAELIAQLDQLPSAEAQIKVFEIENSDATSLAQILQQLFGLPVTAGTGNNPAFGLQNAVSQQLSNLTTGGESSLVQLRVTPDARTNSIIVSGSPSDLEVIEVLLYRLDIGGVNQQRTEVIWLRNSNAIDVATALQQFAQQQLNLTTTAFNLGQASPIDTVRQQALIQAEPSTNSVIISANPDFFEQFIEIIARLDRQAPMIHVDVLLAEISLNDTFEFGVEWGLQDSLLFDRANATGGTLNSPGFDILTPLTNTVVTGTPGNVAGQAVSDLLVGRSSTEAGFGGLVLSASSDSVSALLRTLQDASRLQILSRPQVMTTDNVEGFVQVGSLVPRVTSVTPGTGLNAQQIITQDVPVGLILRILPRTNQDGLILLNVSIEQSSVGPTSTGIPVGFGPNGEPILSPIINRTAATSRISAYDGQTVVYAGLITKTRSSASRRIPFLADIPIAGNLFKFDTEVEERTELLVVLTPRIINSEDDLETINQVESSRMSWCLADVLNIHGDDSLSAGNGLWGPSASPIIYPDLQPAIFEEGEVPGTVLIPSSIEGELNADGIVEGSIEMAKPNLSNGSAIPESIGLPPNPRQLAPQSFDLTPPPAVDQLPTISPIGQ